MLMLIDFPLTGLNNCRACGNLMHHSIEVQRCYDNHPNRKIIGGPKPFTISTNSVDYHCSVCGLLYTPTIYNNYAKDAEERLEKASLCLEGVPYILKPNSGIFTSTNSLFKREEEKLNLIVMDPIKESFGLINLTPELKIKVLTIDSLCYLENLYVFYKDIDTVNFN